MQEYEKELSKTERFLLFIKIYTFLIHFAEGNYEKGIALSKMLRAKSF